MKKGCFRNKNHNNIYRAIIFKCGRKEWSNEHYQMCKAVAIFCTVLSLRNSVTRVLPVLKLLA